VESYHLIGVRPDAFVNLTKFYNEKLANLERIIQLFDGPSTKYHITEVGLSQLINYCLIYELPDDDIVLKIIFFF
jgi:VP5 protein